MFETPTVREALKAWHRYEASPALMVADDLWVYGSPEALLRTQMMLLAQVGPRDDVTYHLAQALKDAEATIAQLRQELNVDR